MGYIHVKKANCKNCYKCLKNCVVKSIRYIDGQVDVISDGCILCGKCVNVCPQGAKAVVNPLEGVLAMLRDPSVKTAVSLAPSYVGAFGYENRYKLIGALKALGFDYVEETAIGAKAVSEAYRDIMEQGSMPIFLTSCCPTVNELVVKYYPELAGYVAPVVSPVVAHGRIIKERLGQDVKVVFVGPCLSKIAEIASHPESVDGAVSFRQLEDLLEAGHIELAGQEEARPDRPSSFSRIYPMDHGIVRDIERLDTDKKALSAADYAFVGVSGLDNVRAFLDEVRQGKVEGPVFAELNACPEGCINGPLRPEQGGTYASRLQVEKYAGEAAGERPDGEDEPAVAMGKVFKPQPIEADVPDEVTIRKILSEIGKPTPDKELNCGSCGYPTCREKAIAVYQKKAELFMCMPYISDLTQSLSNVTLSVTPNSIIAVDRDMRILECNLAAQKQFGVTRKQALHSYLFEYMDHKDFEQTFVTQLNTYDKKVEIPQLGLITEQTLVYVREQNIVIGIIRDVTEEEKHSQGVLQRKLESVEMAQKVIDKQMTVAQEIASLLGETTAETKVTLNKLKDMISKEGLE
ncbi:MAG: PAS domain-containing protein [Clostridiales bacterium]|nr:PAS domain-containing protein [Clostridiales bacterium]